MAGGFAFICHVLGSRGENFYFIGFASIIVVIIAFFNFAFDFILIQLVIQPAHLLQY